MPTGCHRRTCTLTPDGSVRARSRTRPPSWASLPSAQRPRAATLTRRLAPFPRTPGRDRRDLRKSARGDRSGLRWRSRQVLRARPQHTCNDQRCGGSSRRRWPSCAASWRIMCHTQTTRDLQSGLPRGHGGGFRQFPVGQLADNGAALARATFAAPLQGDQGTSTMYGNLIAVLCPANVLRARSFVSQQVQWALERRYVG